MANPRITVELIGDTSGLSKAFKKASGDASSFGGKIGSAFGSIAKAGAFAGVATAVGGLAVTLKAGIGEWQQSTKVAAQTEAVLKSTGGIANVTADQIDSLASSLMRKSGTDDEAIKSGENLLLTFTNVRNEAGKGNDVFDQATATMLDMSTALGQDMKSSAIQLGKALNDPVKGITALTRVGVSFTEQQKAQIKAMAAAGDQMGAQKLILGELNKEFGGSAEAIGNTLPGQINVLKESFNNLAGEAVGKLVPVLQQVVTWVNVHWPQISAVVDAVFSGIRFWIVDVMVPVYGKLIQAGVATVAWFKEHWPEIKTSVLNTWAAIKPAIELLIGAVKLVATTVADHWPAIERNMLALKTVVVDALKVVRAAIQLVVDLLHGDFGKAWEDVKVIVSTTVNALKTILVNSLENMKGAAMAIGKSVYNGIVAGVSGIGTSIAETVTGIKNNIVAAVGNMFAAAKSLGEAILNGIVAGIKGLAAQLETYLKAPLNAVIDAWNGVGIPGFSVGGFDPPGPGPKIPGFSFPGISLPDIPRLDAGGLIDRTGIAMVHKGEIVVPAGAGGGGVTVNINAGNLFGGPRAADELAQLVRQKLLQFKRANGELGLA